MDNDERVMVVNGYKLEQYFHGADPIYIDNHLFNGTWAEAITKCEQEE